MKKLIVILSVLLSTYTAVYAKGNNHLELHLDESKIYLGLGATALKTDGTMHNMYAFTLDIFHKGKKDKSPSWLYYGYDVIVEKPDTPTGIILQKPKLGLSIPLFWDLIAINAEAAWMFGKDYLDSSKSYEGFVPSVGVTLFYDSGIKINYLYTYKEGLKTDSGNINLIESMVTINFSLNGFCVNGFCLKTL